MGDIFHFDEKKIPFQFYSVSHNTALIIIAALILMLYLFRHVFKSKSLDPYIRYSMAVFLVLFEIALYIWYFRFNQWSADATLPFQLCSMTFMLSIIMLISKNYAVYEFIYFAGLGGAAQALLTPAAILSDFPNFTYYYFFIAHGGIVLTCLYMTWVIGYRPRFKSIWKTMLILNLYMGFAVIINKLTGGNYLFISHKPAEASLLDYLGPWPWYIVSMEAAALVIFIILYLPFALMDYLAKR